MEVAAARPASATQSQFNNHPARRRQGSTFGRNKYIPLLMENITAAGNTEVPAYLALQQEGLKVERLIENGTELWLASNESGQYSAPSPLELLGIYSMRQIRGGEWKASDNEIQTFLAAYYPNALPTENDG